jgi:hypothetical protein
MSEHGNNEVWTLRGVSAETRDLVKTAAQVTDEPVGALANRILREGAFKALSIPPLPNSEHPPGRQASGHVELASKIRNIEHRLAKLEKSTSKEYTKKEEESPEGQLEVLDKILQLAKPKGNNLQTRLIATLMEALKEIDDPWLTLQLKPIIFAANSNKSFYRHKTTQRKPNNQPTGGDPTDSLDFDV